MSIRPFLYPFLYITIFLRVVNSQTYLCTNGKDPSNLSKKEILIEFSKSPCSPLIIVPGMLGTKISIEIDCNVLKTQNSEVFKACGWNECKKEFWEFWKYVPSKEYDVWFPDINSPLTILTYSEQKNICWAMIIKQFLDKSKNMSENPKPYIGYKIKVYGNTEKTKDKFKCGDGAIADLLNLSFQISETKAFTNMLQSLKNLGYIAGLTYQSIPYNFTNSYRNNEVKKNFPKVLKMLNKNTKKKVILIGHSMGNQNIYHNLLNLSQHIKDKQIKNWIAICPPFHGSLKVQRNLISGDQELMFFENIIGLHFKASVIGVNHIMGMYELIARDPFSLYRDEEWFRESVVKRMKYENGDVGFEESGFSFLPKVESYCGPRHYEIRDCKMGFYDTSREYSVRILDEEFRIKDTRELLRKHALAGNMNDFFEMSFDEEFFRGDNPGVPVVNVFQRIGKTYKKFDYDRDIRECVESDSYCTPKYTYGYGDDTVPTFSTLTFPFKWAYEFENKKENAKPVKFVDFCSRFNEKYSPYDKMNGDEEYMIEKNEYFGIDCDCFNAKNSKECNHSKSIGDSSLIKFINNSLITNSISFSEEYVDFVASLDDKYLEEITEDCPQVKF